MMSNSSFFLRGIKFIGVNNASNREALYTTIVTLLYEIRVIYLDKIMK